jgi:hypothetical protein
MLGFYILHMIWVHNYSKVYLHTYVNDYIHIYILICIVIIEIVHVLLALLQTGSSTPRDLCTLLLCKQSGFVL